MARASQIFRNMKRLPLYLQRMSLSIAPHISPTDSASDNRFLRHSSPDPKVHDHYNVLHFPETRISTLPNGIRVATETSPSSALHTASVGVWIDAGSRFETPETNGTAHFLEHMIFKGTAHRSARDIEVEIENMGARLNAYTSREQTTFYANVLSDDVPVAIDILADILQNSCFSNRAIERERGVILREMEEVQGQIEEVIFDHLHAAAFQNHPLGYTILGPTENIQTISKGDLYDYISKHYTGPRMVVSAAGAVKHEEVVSQVIRLFNKHSTDPTMAAQLVERNPAVFTASEVRVANDNLPIAHFIVAFKGTSWTDPNSIPLMVIQSLLGSWNRSVGVGNLSGSELARKISNNNLAESMMAFNTNYCDMGLFGMYATAAPDCLPDLSLAIMEDLRRMASQISDVEVVRARNQLKSAMMLHIDGTSAVAENNGRQLLTYGRVVPFLELFARIDAVDAATVMETAQNFIVDKDVAIAALGPIHQLPDYSWFRSETCLK